MVKFLNLPKLFGCHRGRKVPLMILRCGGRRLCKSTADVVLPFVLRKPLLEAMEAFNPSQVTVLLKAWTGGDQEALNLLMPVVYEELRRMARRHLRNERAGNTLQTT